MFVVVDHRRIMVATVVIKNRFICYIQSYSAILITFCCGYAFYIAQKIIQQKTKISYMLEIIQQN